MTARTRLFRHAPVLSGDLGLPPRRLDPRQPPASMPAITPHRPQAPPFLFSQISFTGSRTGKHNVYRD